MSFKLLLDHFPNIAKEWHPSKNNGVELNKISFGSGKRVWWLGECGHEWEAVVQIRTRRSRGCPICAGKYLLPGVNDLGTLRPVLAKEWHPSKNNRLLPNAFFEFSHKKVWWLGKCGHEWEASISNRTSHNRGCPFCSNRKILFGFNDLATTNPLLAAEWHPTKNKLLIASEVSVGQSTKAWWQCRENHEWKAAIYSRAAGTGCPYCSGNLFIAGKTDLKSYSPELAKEWHPSKNENLSPSEISFSNHKKVWWLGKCGHEWESPITSRAQKSGCPICAGNQVLLGFNDVSTNNPELAKEWHPTKNGNKSPQNTTYGSGYKAWWRCSNGHEWQASVDNRNKGRGCGLCANSLMVSKSEKEIVEFLKLLNYKVETSNRKILKGQEIDIYIPSSKVGIEFNGLYWHTESKGKHSAYHYNKWLKAKNSHIELIQVWEDNWTKKPSLTKAFLKYKLAETNSREVKDYMPMFKPVTAVDADRFLSESKNATLPNSFLYFGIFDKEKLQGIIKAELIKESAKNVLTIFSYESNFFSHNEFSEFVKYIVKLYSLKKIIAYSNNVTSFEKLYTREGFIKTDNIEPNYQYLIGRQREDAFKYPLKRFYSDPNLKYEEGLNLQELADLNDLPRIWDAGKTKWVKNFNY